MKLTRRMTRDGVPREGDHTSESYYCTDCYERIVYQSYQPKPKLELDHSSWPEHIRRHIR